MVICMAKSASSIRSETNTLTTSIYGLEEVATSYPIMSDVLGSGVTTSHIGLPINGAETAAMSRLQVEASSGTLN